MNVNRPIAITITPGAVLIVLTMLAGAWVVITLTNLFLVVLLSIVLASAVEPAIRFGAHYKVPRVVSVLAIYLALIGMIIGFFYFFLPPLVQETSRFVTMLPTYLDTLTLPQGVEPGTLLESATQQNLLESLRKLQTTFSTSSSGVFAAVNTVFGGVLSFVLIIVLSFYFAVQERGLDDFLTLVTPKKHQKYVLDLWKRSQHKIGRWMQGQVVLSVMIGVLVYIGLSLMQVEYALLLAIIAGALELIPVFGSILAAIPATIVAFIDGGTTLALLVVAYYIIINQFQGNIVYPLVVQKVIGVPPLLVILSLVIGGQLAGFMGIVLAVPVAAILREFVNDLQKDRQGRDEEPEQQSFLGETV